MMNQSVITHTLFTDLDIHLFREGKHQRIYEKMGSHPIEVDGVPGVYFAVWAPNARLVSVIGHFNRWDNKSHPLHVRWDGSGIWEGFIPGIKTGDTYKYAVKSFQGKLLEKGDPYARLWEAPPQTASVVYTDAYAWQDSAWMEKRHANNALNSPYSVYEVHLGSWKRKNENEFLTYREMAEQLVPYVQEMGYTHVEMLPVMEHPFYGSWGYQVTGYYATSARYGSPADFKFLVDAFHQAGIGVILDWVPSHFPGDIHGLFFFDGSHAYEHADPRQGFHPDWSSFIFNYGRSEVRSFLLSNAIYWLDHFHADGLRVDAVASMLYLDYSRKEGQWIANKHGGKENLEAISLLKEINEAAYGAFPDIQMIAEESTSWPKVSRPIYDGGLGFGMKWMMGWMNDTLKYMSRPAMYRRFHHNEMSFSIYYAYSENFMMPLSHDEVVHGKSSLLGKMPGDEWQRFANLRLMYAYMFTHPGNQLMFMGAELASPYEWRHDEGLPWNMLEFKYHKGIQDLVKKLNHLFKTEPAFYERNYSPSGFEWIDFNDKTNCVLAYIRKAEDEENQMVVVCNFTPKAIEHYAIGVPLDGTYTEVLNTDDDCYSGSGFINGATVEAVAQESHGKPFSLDIKLCPLGVVVLKRNKPAPVLEFLKESAKKKKTATTPKTASKEK